MKGRTEEEGTDFHHKDTKNTEHDHREQHFLLLSFKIDWVNRDEYYAYKRSICLVRRWGFSENGAGWLYEDFWRDVAVVVAL
jgi:hypothetical protein